MRFSCLVLALVLAAGFSVQASELQDLGQIYQEALSHDPVLAAARKGNRV